MSHPFDNTHSSLELLSFGEAGRLTGKPKAYLRELADAGQLAVRLQPGESKLRVTRSALAEAGLLQQANGIALPERGDVSELIALVREQATRISALEEQRFQLGAQLGGAIERVASLEEQVTAIAQLGTADESTVEAIPAESNGQIPSMLHSLLEIGGRNLRLATGLRSRLASSRFRLIARTGDDPAPQ